MKTSVDGRDMYYHFKLLCCGHVFKEENRVETLLYTKLFHFIYYHFSHLNY